MNEPLFKVIHWDYTPPFDLNDSVRPAHEFHYALLRNSEDTKIIGFSFTWKMRLQTVKGVQLLSYIGQSEYFLAKAPSIADIRWCLYDSHSNYMAEYDRRRHSIGLDYQIPLLKGGEISLEEIWVLLKDWKGV